MSTPFEHLINSRIFTSFGSISQELNLEPHKNYLFDLSYLCLLELQGMNAFNFLQGQVTCDVRTISDKHMLSGALCNLKGRILSLVDIIHWDGLKLVIPKDLVVATHASLNKSALLSKVSIQENHDIKCLGFYLQNPFDLRPLPELPGNGLYEQTHTQDAACAHLGGGFYLILIKASHEHSFIEPYEDKGQFLGSLTWHTLRLRQKHLEIYPNSRGLFLPHRLDLQQTPYLSFNKGCYKGQEIVARTHYRATLKHELGLYTVESHEPIFSGQRLLDESLKTELGELIDYSILDDAHYLIAASMLKNAPQKVTFEGHQHALTLNCL